MPAQPKRRGLACLSAPELKERLKKIGLSALGSRSDLLERYIYHDEEAWSQAEKEVDAAVPAWIQDLMDQEEPSDEESEEEEAAPEGTIGDVDASAAADNEALGQVEEDEDVEGNLRKMKKEKKETKEEKALRKKEKKEKKEKKHRKDKEHRDRDGGDSDDDPIDRLMAQKIELGRAEEARKRGLGEGAEQVGEGDEQAEAGLPSPKRLRGEGDEQADAALPSPKRLRGEEDAEALDDDMPMDALPPMSLDDDTPLHLIKEDLEKAVAKKLEDEDEDDDDSDEEERDKEEEQEPEYKALIADDVKELKQAQSDEEGESPQLKSLSKGRSTLPLRREDGFFLKKPLGPSLPSIFFCVAKVSGARVAIHMTDDVAEPVSVELNSNAKNGRKDAARLIKLILQEKKRGGVDLDPMRRHPMVTILRLPALPDVDLVKLGYEHNVYILKLKDQSTADAWKPAKIDNLWPNDEVEIRCGDEWFLGEFKESLRGTTRSLVSVQKAEFEVDNSGIRLKQQEDDEKKKNAPHHVVLFGERHKKAALHLHLIKLVRKTHPKHSFGANAAAALATDGDWGTLTMPFQDVGFAKMCSKRLAKVVGPTVGCSLNFIEDEDGAQTDTGRPQSIAYACGSAKERESAQLILKTLFSAMRASPRPGFLPRSLLTKDLEKCSSIMTGARSMITTQRNHLNPIEEQYGVCFVGVMEDVPSEGGFKIHDMVEVIKDKKPVIGEIVDISMNGGKITVKVGESQITVPSENVAVQTNDVSLIILGHDEAARASARLGIVAWAESRQPGIFKDEWANVKPDSEENEVGTEMVAVGKEQAKLLATESRAKVQTGLQRLSTASRCGIALLGQVGVLMHGMKKNRDLAKGCIGRVFDQCTDKGPDKGGPVEEHCEAKMGKQEVEDMGHLRLALTTEERGALTSEMIFDVEKETKTFMFMRDVTFATEFKPNDKVLASIDGKWTSAKFIRKVPMRQEFCLVKTTSEEGEETSHQLLIKDCRSEIDGSLGGEVVITGCDIEAPGESGPRMAGPWLQDKVRKVARWGTFKDMSGSQRSFWSSVGEQRPKGDRKGKGKGKDRPWVDKGKGKDRKGGKDGKDKGKKGKGDRKGKDGKGKSK